VQCVVSCQAKSKPHVAGTRVAVRSVYWLAPLEATLYGTIVAGLRRRRGARVEATRYIRLTSSSPGNRNDVSVDTYNRTEIAPVVERDLTTRVATSRPAMLTTWNDGAAHRRCKNCKILLLLVKALNNKEVNKRVKVK
jgi:hypothetical protein